MFAKSFVDHLVFRVFPGQNGVFGLVFEVCEQNLFSWCRSHFRGFGMVTVPARIAAGTQCPPRYPRNVHKIFHKDTKRRGGEPGSPPLPYEIRIRNPHRQKCQAHVFLESLELFEEEAFVDLAGVAGLAQVVLFEGACAAGGVSAPAGDCFQVGASRG